MWEWLVLLACVVFFMYLWGTWSYSAPKAKCNSCPNKKNVQPLE